MAGMTLSSLFVAFRLGLHQMTHYTDTPVYSGPQGVHGRDVVELAYPQSASDTMLSS